MNDDVLQIKIEEEPFYHHEVDEGGTCQRVVIVIYDKSFVYYQKALKNIYEKTKSMNCTFKPIEKEKVTVFNFQKKVKEIFQKFEIEEARDERKNVLKLIVFYVGHGATDYRDDHPSFYTRNIPQNTYDIFESIKELDLDLLIFVADCCSALNTMVVEHEVKFPPRDETQISFFDFQGFFYIRSSQKGRYSYGDEEYGSQFLRCLNDYWKVDWFKFIEDTNDVLRKLQVATGNGVLVTSDDRDFTPKDFEWENYDDLIKDM